MTAELLHSFELTPLFESRTETSVHMENNYHLREMILNLQDRLSDSDRKRLHFFLGDDVPRRIRDDPSLGGTLDLFISLFDQDKINEHDFTLLIDAFEAIRCREAATFLRKHMKRMQPRKPHELEQTVDEEVDKINSMISPLINQPSQLKEKKLFKRSWINWKYFFFIIFLFLIVIILMIIRHLQLRKDLKLKEKIIIDQRTKNNAINKQLDSHQSMVNQTRGGFLDKLERQNRTIEQLNDQWQHLFQELARQNQTIEDLHDQLEQSYYEKNKLNETTQQLTDRLHRYQTGKNLTIHSNITTLADCIPTQGDDSCGCPVSSTCRENCISKFCGVDGRCSGFFDIACECLIGGVWQFKGSQC